MTDDYSPRPEGWLSVTEIADRYEDKEGLFGYANREGLRGVDTTINRDQMAEKGTLTHKALEVLVGGEEINEEDYEPASAFVRTLRLWHERHPQRWGEGEFMLECRVGRYRGRVDYSRQHPESCRFCEGKGWALGDAKLGHGPPWLKSCIQVALYRYGYNHTIRTVERPLCEGRPVELMYIEAHGRVSLVAPTPVIPDDEIKVMIEGAHVAAALERANQEARGYVR